MRSSPRCSILLTVILLSWSNRMTMAAMPSQGVRLVLGFAEKRFLVAMGESDSFVAAAAMKRGGGIEVRMDYAYLRFSPAPNRLLWQRPHRSEEHTSELQSHHDLVCRL